MLGWYNRRLMRPTYDGLPKTGAVFSLGEGFTCGQWDALNELARRDGLRLEYDGASGMLDYQLVPILPPLNVAAIAHEWWRWPCPECGAPVENAGGDNWACTKCPHTEWYLRD